MTCSVRQGGSGGANNAATRSPVQRRAHRSKFPRVSSLRKGVCAVPALNWICYSQAGRFCVLLSHKDLVTARQQATADGLDRGLIFQEAHIIDAAGADRVPADMIGRMLTSVEAVQLLALIEAKKPPAPSLRRPTTRRDARRRQIRIERKKIGATN
jgi:hypothetical protein